MSNNISPESGNDAIFLSSMYQVNNLLNDVGDDYIKFFNYLPQYFEGKWEYADRNTELFQEIYSIYNEANFIVSRDGSLKDEFDFIKKLVFEYYLLTQYTYYCIVKHIDTIFSIRY